MSGRFRHLPSINRAPASLPGRIRSAGTRLLHPAKNLPVFVNRIVRSADVASAVL